MELAVKPLRDSISPAFVLLCIYVGSLILLPSGTVKGIPIKIPIFVPLLLLGLRKILQRPYAYLHVGFACLVTGVVTLWAVCSFVHPFYSAYALSQAKDIITTFAGCLLFRIFATDEIHQLRLAKFSIAVVALGSFLKVGLLTYALSTGRSVADYVDQISDLFGVKLMSIDIGDAGGRLLFPSDNVIPVCLFAILVFRKRMNVGWISAVLVFILLVTSSLYTFSRFVWISTLFALLLGLFIGRKDKLNLFYVALAGGLGTILFPFVAAIVTLRFSENLSSASDAERVWQIVLLKNFFSTAPILGHGFGSYILQLKRSQDVPYAYEVQVLAMFGQFGILGVGILGALLANYYRKVFSFKTASLWAQGAVFLLLINLLLAGFFNPSLLASMSSAGYGLLFVLAALTHTANSESARQ